MSSTSHISSPKCPGADTQNTSELGFLPENVHATTAENDGITGLTDLTHGADPTSPDFGATVFESKKGSEGDSWPLRAAHSEYSQKVNDSLEHMGEVIAGQNSRVAGGILTPRLLGSHGLSQRTGKLSALVALDRLAASLT